MSPLTRLPLTIEHALLGFLRERPMHGYEIHQQLREPSGLWLVWRLKQSQLYALLAKLEAEGYISATLKPQETRPARKVFRLTKNGRDRFLAWVTSPVPHGRELRLEFLAKVYFAQHEGRKIATELIERQRTACRNWLHAQRAHADEMHDHQPFEWLVRQFRIGQIEAMLAWLDTCEQTLADLPVAHLSKAPKILRRSK